MRRRSIVNALLSFAVGALLPLLPTPAGGQTPGVRLVEAARAQIGVTLRYDPAYRAIPYPGGDLPVDRGVCTDVVVRAFRRLGVDLQVLVHEDMAADWGAYPGLWGLARPDTNIDHRRVPNLATFFARHGDSLGVSPLAGDYRPGDLVTWRLPSGVPHIGIVSDRAAESGTPLVIHNIGLGTREEDVLFAFAITGHYRYPPTVAPGAGGRQRTGPRGASPPPRPAGIVSGSVRP